MHRRKSSPLKLRCASSGAAGVCPSRISGPARKVNLQWRSERALQESRGAQCRLPSWRQAFSRLHGCLWARWKFAACILSLHICSSSPARNGRPVSERGLLPSKWIQRFGASSKPRPCGRICHHWSHRTSCTLTAQAAVSHQAACWRRCSTICSSEHRGCLVSAQQHDRSIKICGWM